MVQTYVKWIGVIERITIHNLTHRDWPVLLGSLDATVQQINRPQNIQKAYFSGKHKFHFKNTQALVALKGLLIHFSESVPSSVHDFTLLKNSNLKIFIDNENKFCQKFFNSPSTVLADTGY